MTQLESEVAEESSGHPSTRLMFTSFLQNVIQRLFSTFMAQKTARRPKTPQQARRGCKVFFAYCKLLSDLPFGLGFQALKMEVCKSRPRAFGSAAGSFCT
jgi:hypothetical protein